MDKGKIYAFGAIIIGIFMFSGGVVLYVIPQLMTVGSWAISSVPIYSGAALLLCIFGGAWWQVGFLLNVDIEHRLEW